MSLLEKQGVIRIIHTPPLSEGRAGVFCGCGFMHKEDARTVYRDRRFPKFVVIYVEAGGGWYVDGRGIRHRLEAGQVIQMPALEPLSLIHDTDGRWMEWFLEFDPGWVAATAAVGMIQPEVAVLSPGRNAAVERRLARLLSDVAQSPADPRHAAEAFGIWLEWTCAHAARAAAREAVADEEGLAKVARALSERLESRRSIQQLLGLKQPAYEQMRRAFRARFGMSPGRHRIIRRIEAAKAALLDPRKQVKEVAFALGYPDAMTFSKQFAREVGQTPLAFRRKFYRE